MSIETEMGPEWCDECGEELEQGQIGLCDECLAGEETYKIVRRYARGRAPEIVDFSLTLEEAQEHCSNPETSSRTCQSPEGIMRTEDFGPWFDSYEKEDA